MAKSLETIALGVVGEMRRQREPGINPREHRSDAIIVMKALLQVRDDAIAAARDEGRAAGYGEGVKDASEKIEVKRLDQLKYRDDAADDTEAYEAYDHTASLLQNLRRDIRALAPDAPTKEPK